MESSDSYDSGSGGGGGGGRGVICIDYDGRPASDEEVVDGYGVDEDEVRGHLLRTEDINLSIGWLLSY